MRDNKNISLPQSGMNRDKHPQALSQVEYPYALNANIEGEDGSVLMLQNEPSNVLWTRFDGYKVVGYKNDLSTGYTYFFLAHPENHTSKITYLKSQDYIKTIEDIKAGSGLDIHRVLANPMEDSNDVYTPLNEGMQILLEDDEQDPCLRFDIHHPIITIEIKDEKCGKRIYWTDGYNPPRFVDIKLATEPDEDGDYYYSYIGEKICGDNSKLERVKVACDKLRIFPLLDIPQINPEVVEYGGSLRSGIYQFCLALCDKLGNELSNYYSITNPISIFNENDVVIKDGKWGGKTNFGIRLNVEYVDKNASYYKVACIQKTVGFDGVSQPIEDYFIEGVHPITEKSIYYTSDQNLQRTTLEHLALIKPVYKTTRGIVASGKKLLHYGLTVENEWNLQPIANLLGSFMEWRTGKAKESLYKDGVAVSKYASTMRDEVYPYSISFHTDTGYTTARFPLVPRPATAYEMEDTDRTDTNVSSILENVPQCGDTERKKRWQYENTAESWGLINSVPVDDGCITKIGITEERAGEFDFATIGPGLISFEPGDDVTKENLQTYLMENIGELCGAIRSNNSFGPICDAIKTPTPIDKFFPEDLVFPDGCQDIEYIEDKDVITISEIKDPVYTLDYLDADEYAKSNTSTLTPISSVAADRYDIVFGNVEDANFEFIENIDCGGDDCKLCSVSGITEAIVEGKDKGMDIKQTMPCTAGCSVSDPYIPVEATSSYLQPLSFERLRARAYFEAGKPEDYGVENQWKISSEYFICQMLLPKGEEKAKSIGTPAYSELLLNTTGSAFNTGITGDQWDRKAYDHETDNLTTIYNSYFFFSPYVHRDARWVQIDRPKTWDLDHPAVDDFLILEFAGNGRSSDTDFTVSDKIRITFFKDKSGTIYKNLLDSNKEQGMIVKSGYSKIIKLTKDSFKDGDGYLNRIYIAIDTPMSVLYYVFASKKCVCVGLGFSVMTATTASPYAVVLRPKIIDTVLCSYQGMTFHKLATYTASCESCAGENLCGITPYQHGDFGYWESTVKYPANSDLYDSSKIKIPAVYSDIIERLEKYYIKSGTSEVVFTDANMCQKPIRHYKFPDNTLAPFMGTSSLLPNAEADIYPMGVYIDYTVINDFLDIAVHNGLIEEEQRRRIVGYDIYRGDRVLNKSVIATGIGYDMREYRDSSGRNVNYSNYPYNDLRSDNYNYADADRKTYIPHPYEGKGNRRFTFHSPDTHFSKVSIPSELKIEGYQIGYSNGVFQEVLDHPKWIIPGSKLYTWANSFASIEATAGILTTVSDLTSKAMLNGYMGFGLANFTNAWGLATAVVAMGSGIAASVTNELVQFGLRRYQWLDTFIKNGTKRNFAYYYTSLGYYNSFITNGEKDSRIRGISKGVYLKPGLISVSDPGSQEDYTIINNKQREASVYLSVGDDKYKINYPAKIQGIDNSRVEDGCSYDIFEQDERALSSPSILSRIASPYIKLKNYVPDQYGAIDNIRWVSTGHNPRLDEDSGIIFGGDIYISRMSVKRKMPFFYTTAFGIGDMVPFMYNDYRNVGFPKYFVNFDTVEGSGSKGGHTFPNKLSKYKLTCERGNTYVTGKFYLYSYGIPQFLVESEINCNYRLAGLNKNEEFFPHVGDHIEWTQQKNYPIELEDEYLFNPVYLFPKTVFGVRTLPGTYDKKFWDCSYQKPNGVAWSEVDASENNMDDPWLMYKPLNNDEFPASNGLLIRLKSIESEQLLGLFENQVALFNAIDVLKERLTPENIELGTGGLFAGRAIEFNKTDLGFTGSQSTEIISNEYGHFWVDTKRGHVFMVQPNGSGLQPVHPGMANWLEEHLPMKILRAEIINAATGEPITYRDIDNKFFGLGISMGWDNRFKRVFITKKDYIPVREPAYYKFVDGEFYYNNTRIDLRDTSYFQDTSFTIAYSCKKQEWISYYSFLADYYIEHQHYFQTGKNYAVDSREEGLWSHLLTPQSYQVFYGKRYPFIIEAPIPEQYVNKIASAIQYRMEARRYQSDVDFSVNRLIGFNKMWIYNNTNNSGRLDLIPEEKNNFFQKAMYPKDYGDHSEIVASNTYDMWKINTFFNRIKNDLNNIPIWLKDVNDIHKEVNPEALNLQTIWKDRLRGDWFLVRMQNDKESRYKLIFRWLSDDEKIH